MAGTQRKQNYSSFNDKKHIIYALALAGFILIITVLVAIISQNLSYSPPEHDQACISGTPEVDDGYLYKEIDSHFGYSFSMAANLYRQEDGSVNIYLTNPKSNDIDILCEIYEKDSALLLYKSGRICPNEYLPSLVCKEEVENKYRDILVKIYAFKKDDFTSAGTTELNLALQPW